MSILSLRAMPGGPNGQPTPEIPISNADDLGLITLNQLTNVDAGSPANNQVIAYNSSTARWEQATQLTAEVVDDTSPQLGGNLDINTHDITGTGAISITAMDTDLRNELKINVQALSGGNQNPPGTLRLTKVTNNSTRRNFLFFGTENVAGDTVVNQASIDARWDGTRKRLRFMLPNDDFSSSVIPLDMTVNQSTLETNINFTGEINATNPSSDLTPNSMKLTTVMDDPTVDDTQNHITCINDYGAAAITNGTALLYAFEAINDADSSGRIGGIKATYNSDENLNEVAIDAQSHDFGVTSRKKIGTTLLNAFSEMPFKFPSFTDTERNAMSPAAGWVLYNSTENELQVYNGTAWKSLDMSAV